MKPSLEHCLSSAIALNPIKEKLYLTYPHSNGFLNQDEILLLKNDNGWLTIYLANTAKLKADFLSKSKTADIDAEITELDCLKVHDTEIPYIDCQNESFVSVVDNCLYVWQRVDGYFIRTLLFSGSKEERLNSLCSIDRFAEKVLFSIKISDKHYRACEISIHTREMKTLLEVDYYANHFHYSPADPRWFVFSHEGNTLMISDRIHTWNRKENPEGKCGFNQHRGDMFLSIGHERCSFHDKSMAIVAYGDSRCGPRGIYEAFFDNRAPVLISEGNRDWHVNISKSGKYYVVDTTAPTTLPGKGWDNSNGESDIILIDHASGKRKILAQIIMGKKHPWHPHPCFSPDEKWIFYNEATSTNTDGQNQIKMIYIGDAPF